jgi:two-component system chemotaxis response regulator CheB
VIKLLVVDDSALMRRVLGDIFKPLDDFQVAFARDGIEALRMLHDFQPDVITLDVQMPHMDGLACLDRIMLERPSPVIMVSSLTDAGADETLEAMQLGAVDFIPKPAGAVSLALDELGPAVVAKVRAASKARLRPTLRLTERVRLRARGDGERRNVERNTTAKQPIPKRSTVGPEAKGPADRVVLVGTSTGGPPALDALLSRLPADFPWPILVAQHMPGTFTGPLARRLDRLCALTVSEVTRPVPLTAGQVYIGKGDADVIVSMRSGELVVAPAPALAEYHWHPSVDRLVSTAMAHIAPSQLIGVLMTGMGSDGATSMTRLLAEGGRTIAESEETAVVWGMPGELVRAGGAEIVAPVDQIADQLLEWVQ